MIGKIVSRCGKIQLVGIYNWKHIYNNTANQLSIERLYNHFLGYISGWDISLVGGFNQVDVYYFWDLFMYYKDLYDLVGGIPTS